MPANIELIRYSDWPEVKGIWQEDEDSDAFRREYAEQGYDTWESWRKIIIDPLHLDKLDWKVYDVKNPLTVVPGFRGGPFVPWKNMYYGDKTLPTFADIVATKDTDVATRNKFAEIIAMQKPICLIGLQQGNDIYIIEGMHRSTSLALAAYRGLEISVSVKLFLAESDLPEFPMIG